MRRFPPVTLFLLLIIGSCSSGPESARPGTPAFFWGAAQNAWQSGEFIQAAESLEKIPTSDTEFRPRAEIALMVLSAGLAKGDMEWADTLALGGKYARDRQLVFLKNTTAARTAASQNAMRFTESVHRFMAGNKDEEVVFALPKPGNAPDKPAELERLSKGLPMLQNEMDQVHAVMLRRGVRLECDRIGAGPAEIKLKRPALLWYIAQTLTDLADLYDSKKLNHAGRVRMLTDEAQEALTGLPPSDDIKKLTKRIQDIRGKLPKT